MPFPAAADEASWPPGTLAGTTLPVSRPSPERDLAFGRARAAFGLETAPRLFSAVPESGAADPGTAAGFAPEELPGITGSAVEMLIITTAPLEADFQVLADWKTRKGVPTVVRTMAWIDANYPTGHDRPERVRDFLRDAYDKWGTYLVLLGGDAEQIPAREALSRFNFAVTGGEVIPTDQYYACLEGNWNADGDADFGEALYLGDPGDAPDMLPDVFVGRAPVETSAEAQTFVQKSLSYDRTPPAGYVETASFLAEVLEPAFWECPDSTSAILNDGRDAAESLRALLPPTWTVAGRYQSGCDLDRGIALAEFAAAPHLMAVIGHGDAFKLSVGNGATPFVFQADVGTFTNAPRYSFLYTVSCNTNQLDVECQGETFMNLPGGGAIAVVSATRGDYPGPSETLRGDMLRLAFQHGITRFGAMTQLMRVPSVGKAGTDHLAFHWTHLTTMLFGDPEIRLWTREPAPLSVAHASEWDLGSG
ncbi:MAG: hypothetical protein HKN12_08050, partial [Gemmatimonadetes bacterium]|nr:hypothetical protein [Gemmatimonadota bacterium]